MDTTTGLRLDPETREKLDEIARPYHTTPSALIRIAVDQLIAAVEKNHGQLPPVVENLRDRAEVSANHEEPATAVAR